MQTCREIANCSSVCKGAFFDPVNGERTHVSTTKHCTKVAGVLRVKGAIRVTNTIIYDTLENGGMGGENTARIAILIRSDQPTA